MQCGINPHQKHHHLFSTKPPIKSANCPSVQAPLFTKFLLIYWFFVIPRPVKNLTFVRILIIKNWLNKKRLNTPDQKGGDYAFASLLILIYQSFSLILDVFILKDTEVFGPASARLYKIGVVGNNWLVGWLVKQFSQKRL